MSLLLFGSYVCAKAMLQEYFPHAGFEGIVESVQCTQGHGSRCAIAATVLYFLCIKIVPFRPVHPVASPDKAAPAALDEVRSIEEGQAQATVQ